MPEYNRSGMDPDRYQMRDLKRRMASQEKALLRAEARIRDLQSRAVKHEADRMVFMAIAKRLEERIS